MKFLINFVKIIFLMSIIYCIIMASRFVFKADTSTPSEPQETPAQKENTLQKPKKPQSVKTFGKVRLKEIYSYPKHGFYAYEFEDGDISDLTFFDNMAQELKYSSADFLGVFIYDKNIDKNAFLNAPKNIPISLIIEAEKQKPFMYFTSGKGLQDNMCEQYGQNYYYRSFKTNWQWKPETEEKTAEYCKYM